MDFNKQLELGKKLINENIDEALIIFENLKSKFLNKEEILFELGKIYYIKQDFLKAKKNLELIKNKRNNYHLNLLLSKVYKSLNKSFSTLKILLKLYKQSKNEELEKEIINLFLESKQDFLAIKFLLKNNKQNIELDNIIKFCLNNISKEVANNNFDNVKQDIKKLINIFNSTTNEDEFIREKNILLNEYEIGMKEIKLKSKPRYLTITLTNKCNLKCKMCYVWKHNYKISNKIIKDALNIFPYLETIVWLGGEIFLYENIEELLMIANKYHIRQSIATNGLLLNEDIIKKIMLYDLDLTISIDSINKSVYENIRVGAQFENLLNNLKLIKKYMSKTKSNLFINVVVSKWNIDEKFYDFIYFARKYNVSKITYNIDMTEQNNQILIDNFNNKYRNKIVNAGLKENINIVINIPQYQSQNNCNDIKKYDICLRPWKGFVIDIDGYVKPDCYCNNLGKMSTGDKIINVWNSQSFINFRKNMLNVGNSICTNSCKNNILDFQRFKM